MAETTEMAGVSTPSPITMAVASTLTERRAMRARTEVQNNCLHASAGKGAQCSMELRKATAAPGGGGGCISPPADFP